VVFVCYSDHDRDIALGVVSALEAHGINVWVAPRDVVPGADWAEQIVDAISAAQLMVFVFSSHSNASPQVRREIERAVHKQVPILPFRTEDILPSKSLEYFLSAQHWLDAFPPPHEAYYERLRRHVMALLGTGTPVAAVNVAAGPRPSAFGARELQLLDRQLAYHLGPVARYLVRRAAAEAHDWMDLTARVAREIDSSTERQHFLEVTRALVPGS